MRNIILLLIVVILITTLVSNAAIITRYSFEQNLTDSAVDGSDADNLTGTYSYGCSFPRYEPGIIGWAIRVGDPQGAIFLSAPDSADLDLNNGRYTIEAFIRPELTVSNSYCRLLSKWVSGTSPFAFHFALKNVGEKVYKLDIIHNDGSNQNITSHNKFFSNKWYHVAVTADGNEIKLWINGQEEGTVPYNGRLVNSPSAMWVGGMDNYGGISNPSNNYFPGCIDEVLVWNEAKDSEYMLQRANLIGTRSSDVPEPSNKQLLFFGFLLASVLLYFQHKRRINEV